VSVSELSPLRHAGVMDSLDVFSNVILRMLRNNADRIRDHATCEVNLERRLRVACPLTPG
jgi:hypothetical protein